MKKLIHFVSAKFLDTPYSKVWDKIAYYNTKIVSFDVFDTLIKRNVSRPEIIFELLEERYKEEFQNRDCCIKIGRIKAETFARQQCNAEEVTINDIYSAWSFSGLSADELEWLKKEEIKLEIALCQKNWEIEEIYYKCLEAGKKVYLVSDMYLPIDVVEKILTDAGYSNWEGIYLSSDKMKTKHSGNLYRLVANELGIQPSEITHVGDALIGDYLKPKKLGFSAIKIPTSVRHREFPIDDYRNLTPQGNILHTLINNNIDRIRQENGNREIESYFSGLGFEVLGPILYGYSEWLQTKLQEQEINNVFFLAREGGLLDKAFQILQERSANRRSHMVLRVSRRATDEPNVNQLSNIKKYLENVGMTCNNTIRNAAVCDVGWRGTIQMNLQKIVSGDTVLYGYYCGLKRKDHEKRLENIAAYLFDYDNITSAGEKERMDCIMASPDLLELFFLSTDGTTLSYNEYGMPILGEPEHSRKASKVIEGLQSAALTLLKLYSELMASIGISASVPVDEIFQPYRIMIRKRSRKLVHMLEKLDSIDKEPLVFRSDRTLKDYVFKPKQFKSDFLNTSYKSLLLEHLLKIKLPYVDIIAKLRRFE